MSLDDWNNYTGKSWLDASQVDENQAFGVVSVEESDDGKPLLTLQRDGVTYLFELNVTNSIKCKEFVESPRALIGKKVYFKTVKVTSPKTKKEVDALRIYNII